MLPMMKIISQMLLGTSHELPQKDKNNIAQIQSMKRGRSRLTFRPS